MLTSYSVGPRLLEIGCGAANDACQLGELGFDYLGLDISDAAVCAAKDRCRSDSVRFARVDFFRWSASDLFDVVYEKGVFHGLAGVRRRNAFVRRVAARLRPAGIWVTVCGSADHRRKDFSHGAIYLRDLVGPAEIYFEVLEVVKAPYGLSDKTHDFEAWHATFRRR